jgi:hypothetical protein
MISAQTARIDDNLGRGTDGSNPLPSSGESGPNLIFGAESIHDRRGFRHGAPIAVKHGSTSSSLTALTGDLLVLVTFPLPPSGNLTQVGGSVPNGAELVIDRSMTVAQGYAGADNRAARRRSPGG